MPLPLLAIAALGFAKGGGIEGIVGSGKRKREQARSRVDVRQRQNEYENFDYNQDVGYINNPYKDQAKKTQEFAQENIDRSTAGGINALQQGGQFGATQALLNSQTQARRSANQQIQQIQTQGRAYVEQQRQQRVGQRYDQAETFFARAENRLAAANKARQVATEKIASGVSAGLTAGVSAGVAGGAFDGVKGNFDANKALKGSGLFSSASLGNAGGSFDSAGRIKIGDDLYQKGEDGTLTIIKE